MVTEEKSCKACLSGFPRPLRVLFVPPFLKWGSYGPLSGQGAQITLLWPALSHRKVKGIRVIIGFMVGFGDRMILVSVSPLGKRTSSFYGFPYRRTGEAGQTEAVFLRPSLRPSPWGVFF